MYNVLLKGQQVLVEAKEKVGFARLKLAMIIDDQFYKEIDKEFLSVRKEIKELKETIERVEHEKQEAEAYFISSIDMLSKRVNDLIERDTDTVKALDDFAGLLDEQKKIMNRMARKISSLSKK